MSIYDYDNDFTHYECDENKHSIMERYYNISANEHEPILLEKLNMTAIWNLFLSKFVERLIWKFE